MQPESARFLPPGLSASLSGPIAHDLGETGIAEVAMSVFGDPDVVPLCFGGKVLIALELSAGRVVVGAGTWGASLWMGALGYTGAELEEFPARAEKIG